MDNAPWFEDDGLFDQSRVKLTDTDGSGTTDILYLASDAIRVYLNEAGNGWSAARGGPCNHISGPVANEPQRLWYANGACLG